MQATDLKTQIQEDIAANKVIVYSKTFCPFCDKTKELLNSKGVAYKLHELDQLPNGADIQATLKTLTNQNTVPNIFINGAHIGGNSDLQALNSAGKLDEKLAAAKL